MAQVRRDVWSNITRHLIIPIHERLLKRPTMRCLRELEVDQWRSPNAVIGIQECKLRALLSHAYANVPHYGNHMRQSGLHPDHMDPFQVLADMPLLTKSDIRKSIREMVWSDAPGGLFPYDTGGSTGEPLQFYFDRRRQAYDQAARMRAHRWFGVRVGDPELFLWGSPIELSRTDRIKRLRDSLFNHRLLDAFKMSAPTMDRYLDTMERFNPVCLFGYPSSLALLARHAESCGRSVSLPRLKAVFASGEVCFPHDRHDISAVFGAPVADNYGSREGGFIAHECAHGGMHITAENVIVEVINDGRGVEEGATGEIVITHLDAFAMPFIRYRTGDIGRLRTGRCACGRGLPLLDVVEGRNTDFLYMPNGDIKHALSVVYPIRALPGVNRFRVVQDVDYAITVEVVPEQDGQHAPPQVIARKVSEVLGDSVDLRVELVPHIPAMASGKFHYVTSKATPKETERLAFNG